MTTKQEVQQRINAASHDCEVVQAAWVNALRSLEDGVSTNGYGIYHDRGEPLRQKLLAAKLQIDQALAVLKEIDWPTDADYDQV